MEKCKICSSEKTKKILNWKTFSVLRCCSCDLLFATPQPTDETLAAFYQGFMFKKPETHALNKSIKAREKELGKLFKTSVLNLQKGNNRFLDYGGGTGVSFSAAYKLGFEAYYHDLDKEAEAFSKLNCGLTDKFIIEDLSECSLDFNYIFSDNVIEHVKEPVQFVNNLLERLSENGKLIIKTPNARNTETFFNPFILIKIYFLNALKYNTLGQSIKAFFNRFWHCDPPRHLYSFSKESIDELVDRVKEKKIKHEVMYYNTPWFRNTVTESFFSKDRRLSWYASIGIRLLIWPIVLIEVVLQLAKHMLLSLGVISPGGIILKLEKVS